MKFKEVIVDRKDYNIALISWTYLPNIGVSESNYSIRISLSGVKEGPFHTVGEVPASQIYFEFPTFFRKWQYYYYKLEIIGLGSVTDSRIVELSEHTDPYVRKIRKKYSMYLSKRVKNPIKIFKKKKNGHKCKNCWDPRKDEFVKSQCPVCFGTGYGDDNVFGAENLRVDGWLKKNHLGNLEFFRHDWTFEAYPAINSEMDFGIHYGDEFRIEDEGGSPLASFNVKGSAGNSIFLDYNSSFLDYLQDNKFSIYGLNLKSQSKILTRIINEPSLSGPVVYRFYHQFLDTSNFIFDGIAFDDPSGTILGAEAKDGYISITDNSFLNTFDGCSTVYLMDGNTIVTSITTDSMLIYTNQGTENDERCILWLSTNNLVSSDRLYIEYLYDGVYETIIDGKTYKLSNNKISGNSLAYFTILSKTGNTAQLHLETLSEYLLTDPDLYEQYSVENYKINFMMNGFAKSNLNMSTFRVSDRYAMYRNIDKFKPNTIYTLDHSNIKKDAFDGCGVLLIDIINGKTYRGPTWTGTEYLDDGDFYVNPEMTEFNTLDLDEGTYELTYIYKLKDLEFKSYFIPKNVELEKGRITTNKWLFKHPNLIGKENLVGKKLTVSEKDIYEEFEIKIYNSQYGIIECENIDLDADDLYNNLTEASIFDIIFPFSGGYYKEVDSWINYNNSLSKIESLREEGSSSDVMFNSLTYFYPRIEPDDLIYDIKTRLFYNVEQVDTPYFRRAELFQKMLVKEAPTSDMNNLYGLLKRTYDETDIPVVEPGVVTPIGPVILLLPANLANDVVYSNADLSWEALDGADSYIIQIANDIAFTDKIFETSNWIYTTLTVPEGILSGLTEYFWRVIPVNENGQGYFSAIRRFTTIDTIPTLPDAPVLVSPIGSTEISETVDFIWEVSARSESYDFQLATDSGFVNLLVDTNLETTTYEYTFTSNNTFYWRVRGRNTYGVSDWQT